MREPGRSAIGTWSGGRFLRFGEAIDEERLASLLRPGEGIETVLTADAYGQGEADRVLGAGAGGVPREDYCLIGAVGHDFYEGERDGPQGLPSLHRPDACAGPASTPGYLRMADRAQPRADRRLLLRPAAPPQPRSHRLLQRGGLGRDGGAARGRPCRRGSASRPGPANGFTLDLISCLERFGERIDWAMIILNPFEPWPGELCLDAAARHGVKVITRVVDYGGLFWGDLRAGMELAQGDHRAFRPAGWIEAGPREAGRQWRRSASAPASTPIQLACQWNLAHPAVECVVPTLIQEAGD